jgi:hypothetical protein
VICGHDLHRNLIGGRRGVVLVGGDLNADGSATLAHADAEAALMV